VIGPQEGAREKEAQLVALFLLPALAIYVVFLVAGHRRARDERHDWDGLSGDFAFVGLDNFRRIITDDPIFRQTSQQRQVHPDRTRGADGVSLLLALMSSEHEG